METEEGVELREDDETGSNGSSKKDPVEEFLKARRGGTEATVVFSCNHCRRRLSKDPVPLSVGRKLFTEHLEEEHPEITPRGIQSIRRELQEEKRAAKKRQDSEKGKAKPIVSGSRRPRKTSQFRSRTGPPSRQPDLTNEMIEKMRSRYGEMGSILRVAKHCYTEFGFSSPERLRNALSKARRENGVVLGIPRNQRRLTKEMIEKARRLYREEGLSVREIARRYHLSWDYSLNGLQNALCEVFKDAGIDIQEGSRKMARKPSKMTPERIGVAWQLYSVGNYSLREIGEISYKLWGYKPSSCQNSIGEALKGAGYKLRASKWEQGPRAIEREVAIEMIQIVS